MNNRRTGVLETVVMVWLLTAVPASPSRAQVEDFGGTALIYDRMAGSFKDGQPQKFEIQYWYWTPDGSMYESPKQTVSRLGMKLLLDEYGMSDAGLTTEPETMNGILIQRNRADGRIDTEVTNFYRGENIHARNVLQSAYTRDPREGETPHPMIPEGTVMSPWNPGNESMPIEELTAQAGDSAEESSGGATGEPLTAPAAVLTPAPATSTPEESGPAPSTTN